MITTTKFMNTSSTSQLPSVCVVRTVKIYSLKLQAYSMALLTAVPTLCIRYPGLIHLTTANLCPLPALCPFPPPPARLCVYEYSV